MSITIDASEIYGFAQAANAVPKVLGRELAKTANALAMTGIGFAQEYAPVDQGALKGGIRMLQRASVGANVSASYGISKGDVIYAFQREFGGDIYARNAPFLVFQIDGEWIATKKVHQRGSRYMGRSKQSLEPLIGPAFQLAVKRAMASFGGAA